jgi:hypothetical protein
MDAGIPTWRPAGVTALSMLWWAVGGAAICAGAGLLALVLACPLLPWRLGRDAGAAGVAFGVFLALVLAGAGVIAIIEGRGLWLLREWARGAAIVVQALGIAVWLLLIPTQTAALLLARDWKLLSPSDTGLAVLLIGVELTLLALQGLALWYLLTSAVARAFADAAWPQTRPWTAGLVSPAGRGSARLTAQIGLAPASSPGTSARVAPAAAAPVCPSCRRRLRLEWRFCPYCRPAPARAPAMVQGLPSSRCPNAACRRVLRQGWRFCPYCRPARPVAVRHAGEFARRAHALV